MKKSLIALAVAGAFAAPAFAATSNVDVYGVMNIAVEDTSAAGVELAVVDRQSRIGFKGSEDLGGGLKAIWQIESTISAGNTDGVGGGTLAGRNTFVGLAGDFGTFVMGRHDTPYKLATSSLDPFADTIADYNGSSLSNGQGGNGAVSLITGSGLHDHRSNNAIAYISPTVGGFHVAAAVVATNVGNGAVSDAQNDTFDAYSLAAVYSNGPVFASLGYQNANVSATADNAAWKLGVGYNMGDAKVGFIYEDMEDTRSSWIINGVYNMGPMALKAEYGRVDVDGSSANPTQWALGLDYSMSKRTTAYAVWTKWDNDAGTDDTGYSLGIKHSF